MISIQSLMLVALGFFAATLLGFLLAPLYRQRAARLAVDALKATMPISSAEIAADKDRLRAQFALNIHRLEKRLEEASFAAAKQRVEINRRDAWISALEGDVQELRSSLDEHENARRVLEQTITERLPRVELRLQDAKKSLSQRDSEILNLTQTTTRQMQALEEATQINVQQRDEVHRLNATLAARAARNRDVLSDPRFDSEVALRAEIEQLRSKSREQAGLIGRLQGMMNTPASGADGMAATAGDVGQEAEIARLKKELVELELALRAARGAADSGTTSFGALETEIRSLKSKVEDQSAEVARLKGALKAYEDHADDDRALKDSKIAMRARMSALQAQADENSQIILRLRAEVAAANERLARQSSHFMDEMRRLGAGVRNTTGGPQPQGGRDDRAYAAERSARGQPLVDRITQPRLSVDIAAGDGPGPATGVESEERNGRGASAELSAAAKVSEAGAKDKPVVATPRRAGLLERIGRSEKPVN